MDKNTQIVVGVLAGLGIIGTVYFGIEYAQTLKDFRATTKASGVGIGGIGGGNFSWPSGITESKKKKYAPQKTA